MWMPVNDNTGKRLGGNAIKATQWDDSPLDWYMEVDEVQAFNVKVKLAQFCAYPKRRHVQFSTSEIRN